jgi:hypothetical protein
MRIETAGGAPRARTTPIVFRWPLITLAVLLLVNMYVFKLFDTSYVGWFISYGTLINLLASVITVGWADLNRNKHLISSSPRLFVASNLLLIAVQFTVMGHEFVEVGKRLQTPARRIGDALDSIGLLVTGGLMLLAIVGWALVVAPLQYWVVLLTGAPARLSLRAPTKIIARMEDVNLDLQESSLDDENPPAWWTASLNAAPVTVTHVATALFLFVISAAVDWFH